MRDVRILSARCFGAYARGVSVAVGLPAPNDAPQSPQNFFQGIVGATLGASICESGAAVAAEAFSDRVIRPAFRALHSSTPRVQQPAAF